MGGILLRNPRREGGILLQNSPAGGPFLLQTDNQMPREPSPPLPPSSFTLQTSSFTPYGPFANGPYNFPYRVQRARTPHIDPMELNSTGISEADR